MIGTRCDSAAGFLREPGERFTAREVEVNLLHGVALSLGRTHCEDETSHSVAVWNGKPLLTAVVRTPLDHLILDPPGERRLIDP